MDLEKEFISKKGKKILFRPLSVSNIDEALRYINKLSREDTFILYAGEEISRAEELKYLEQAKQHLEGKTGIKIGAFYNQQLVGTCDMVRYDRRKRHVGLVGLSIEKEFRGEGIGTALINFVLQLGKEYLGLRIATLGVFANNPRALNIYKKNGFTIYGTLPEGLSYRGSYLDHVLMYRKL